MNGAGVGARLVARRVNGRATADGRSQLGSREQRRQDLRMAFRNMGDGVGQGKGSVG